MVYAVAAIAFLSFIVWAHHMFTVGMPLAGELFFMYTTVLMRATGVKVFNWVANYVKKCDDFETPMLFAIGFVILFTIEAFRTYVVTPVDFQYHDTYFVVAHLLRVSHWCRLLLMAATYFGYQNGRATCTMKP